MMESDSERSIVEYFSEHERYRCGYCGCSDTNYSHGMWAHLMTVQDYQDLIDRGWRRSGKYVYKPTMDMTCCPQHTIKCAALDFKMNKSHKKLIKRVNRYLIYGENKIKSKPTDSDDPGADCTASASVNMEDRAGTSTPSDIKLPVSKVPDDSTKASRDVQSNTCNKVPESTNVRSAPKLGTGPDPNLPPCKKAKQIRLDRKRLKQGKSDNTKKVKPSNSEEKTLEDYLSEPEKAENPVHKLEIKLVQYLPKDHDFAASFVESHKVYLNYQTAVHKDPPSKPNVKQFKRFLCDSPLKIQTVQSHPLTEPFYNSFKESHSVFKSYQMSVHKEPAQDCTERDFKNFLVDSPLKPVKDNLPMGYGSFHQHYILDGKLIAVGVIDILPSCVSSVYLYYDPEYHFLSLGTYTALRELAFVRELNKHAAELKYYYMGFYIHTCPKMKYKGQYYPSFIACPQNYQWVPIEKCQPKLEVSKYSKLDDSNTEDENSNIDINKVLIFHGGESMTYEVYKATNPKAKDEEEVKEYAMLTGKTCSQRMLLFRK